MRLTSAAERRTIHRQAPADGSCAAGASVPGPSVWSSTNRAALPGLVAFLWAAGFVIVRVRFWAHGQIGAFIMVGRHFAHPAQLPQRLPLFDYGYDGQFFYRLALDPANLHLTAFGITMDEPYRYTRIGYPALTWLISLGQHQIVPVALVGVNIAAIAGLGVLGGLFARQSGRHALWGLLMPAYFGLLISLGRDTAEPLAAACLLGGMLAYRRRRPAVAAALFAYGALTRETVLIVPAAIAIVRLAQLARQRFPRPRPGAADLAWVVPIAIFAGWQFVGRAATGELPLFADRDRNVGTPFAAASHAVLYNFGHITTNHLGQLDAWLVEFTTLAVVSIAALLSLRATAVPAHERLAFVLYLAEVCVLTPTIWRNYADFRSLIEVYVLAVIILLAAPLRLARVRPGGRGGRPVTAPDPVR